MTQYRCWSPDDGDESCATLIATTYSGPRGAAELFVEREWASFDHAEVVTVHVADEHNLVTYWSVTVTHSPSFDATQLLHYQPDQDGADPGKSKVQP